jgi:DeoR family transcriptional regulator of aga operon
LAAKDKIDLMVTGGTLLKGSYSLVGPECTSAFQRINADKLLLAASGVDISSGLTVSNALEAEAKRHMIASAKEIILVADSSKFGKRSLISYAPLSAVNMIITNSDIPHDVEDAITEMGIRLYKTY